MFIIAAVVLFVFEAINLHVRASGPGLADPPILDMFRTWPRPTRPGFVFSGIGFATIAIVTAIELTEPRSLARPVVALQAAGQLALTLYILHVPAVLVPLAHGWMPETLLGVLSYATAYYAACIAAALWWRRRYPKGPFEGLLGAITNAPAARTDGRLAG